MLRTPLTPRDGPLSSLRSPLTPLSGNASSRWNQPPSPAKIISNGEASPKGLSGRRSFGFGGRRSFGASAADAENAPTNQPPPPPEEPRREKRMRNRRRSRLSQGDLSAVALKKEPFAAETAASPGAESRRTDSPSEFQKPAAIQLPSEMVPSPTLDAVLGEDSIFDMDDETAATGMGQANNNYHNRDGADDQIAPGAKAPVKAALMRARAAPARKPLRGVDPKECLPWESPALVGPAPTFVPDSPAARSIASMCETVSPLSVGSIAGQSEVGVATAPAIFGTLDGLMGTELVDEWAAGSEAGCTASPPHSPASVASDPLESAGRARFARPRPSHTAQMTESHGARSLPANLEAGYGSLATTAPRDLLERDGGVVTTDWLRRSAVLEDDEVMSQQTDALSSRSASPNASPRSKLTRLEKRLEAAADAHEAALLSMQNLQLCDSPAGLAEARSCLALAEEAHFGALQRRDLLLADPAFASAPEADQTAQLRLAEEKLEAMGQLVAQAQAALETAVEAETQTRVEMEGRIAAAEAQVAAAREAFASTALEQQAAFGAAVSQRDGALVVALKEADAYRAAHRAAIEERDAKAREAEAMAAAAREAEAKEAAAKRAALACSQVLELQHAEAESRVARIEAEAKATNREAALRTAREAAARVAAQNKESELNKSAAAAAAKAAAAEAALGDKESAITEMAEALKLATESETAALAEAAKARAVALERDTTLASVLEEMCRANQGTVSAEQREMAAAELAKAEAAAAARQESSRLRDANYARLVAEREELMGHYVERCLQAGAFATPSRQLLPPESILAIEEIAGMDFEFARSLALPRSPAERVAGAVRAVTVRISVAPQVAHAARVPCRVSVSPTVRSQTNVERVAMSPSPCQGRGAPATPIRSGHMGASHTAYGTPARNAVDVPDSPAMSANVKHQTAIEALEATGLFMQTSQKPRHGSWSRFSRLSCRGRRVERL